MIESVPIIDCDTCLTILQYLSEYEEVEFRVLDGYLRTKGTTTTAYHLDKHLKPNDFISVSQRGLVRKRRYVKITEKGRVVLKKTSEEKKKKEKGGR